jgi:uncharacterized membrane protein
MATRVGQFAVVVVAFYIFLKMFYFFNEGLAQPADIILAAVALLIASPKLIMAFGRSNIALVILFLWIAAVNFTWALITNKLNMAIPISYYLFNIVVTVTAYAVRLRNPEMFDRYVIIAIRLAAVVQLVAVLLDPSFRPLGTFQNPNQLAYWGIVILSTYLVLRRNQSYWSDLPFLVILTYCVIASLSRAGAIAALLLLAVWFWMILRTAFRRALGVAVGLLLVAAASQTNYIEDYLNNSATAANFQQREAGDNTSLAEERNYDRIVEYYEYTLLGAGEGFYSRFEPTNVVAIEIHSSFGTMLFSYGIVGLTLFCAFLWKVIRGLPIALGWYLIPSLIYGITHQGLRFSFFWVLIGIMIALGEQLQHRSHGGAEGRAINGWPLSKPDVVLRPRAARGPQELRSLASHGAPPRQ